MLDKDGIAKRIAQEIQHNSYVNLGIGIPTLVANYIPKNIQVCFQSENGLLGMGPFPFEKDVDADLINAGKQTITMLPGASIFDSAMSFGMIHAQKIDLTILGAMEVSEKGDIANWKIPGKMVKGMGGAMDLVASAKNIIVAMQHINKAGESKLLPTCSLPLTGINCVKKIVTVIFLKWLLIDLLIYKLPLKARSLSKASNKALKFPAPNDLAPFLCIIS